MSVVWELGKQETTAMTWFQSRFKKERRWICSCKRINDADETICRFCQQPKPEPKQLGRIAKKTAYDELTLWPVFSKFIRVRYTDSRGFGKCFTCPRIIHWTKGDCGHGIPRQYKGTKYNEQNNHLQCKSCNAFHGGVREGYKEEMDKRYGTGTWDKMLVASRGIFKLGKTEVDFLTADYQKRVDELLKTKT